MNRTSEPGPVLLLEGGRTNLIPGISAVSESLEKAGLVFDLSEASALGQGRCWRFPLPAGATAQLSLGPIQSMVGQAFSASAFVWSEPASFVTVIAAIQANDNIAQSTFSPQRPQDRVAVSVLSTTVVNQVSSTWRFRNTSPNAIVVCLSYPCIECGAFPSSPIEPGNERGPELLDLKDDAVFFGKAPEGTMIMLLAPRFSAHELTPTDEFCLFGAASNDGSFLELLCLGQHQGTVCVRYRGLLSATYVTGYRPAARTVLALTLIWSGSTAVLNIDGHTHAVLDKGLPTFKQFSHIRFGNSPISDVRGAFIGLQRISVWSRPFQAAEIQAWLASEDPQSFPHFISAARALSTYSTSSWPQDAVWTIFRIVLELQENPGFLRQTQGGLDEGLVRDQMKIALRGAGSVANAEVQNDAGRTDLLIDLIDRSKVRIECKIWGRNDYDVVPTKPLKYMTDGERLGIVLMINPNKSEIREGYSRNVQASNTGYQAIHDAPFGIDSTPDHFVSVHIISGKRVDILHIVLSVYSPLERLHERYRSGAIKVS